MAKDRTLLPLVSAESAPAHSVFSLCIPLIAPGQLTFPCQQVLLGGMEARKDVVKQEKPFTSN